MVVNTAKHERFITKSFMGSTVGYNSIAPYSLLAIRLYDMLSAGYNSRTMTASNAQVKRYEIDEEVPPQPDTLSAPVQEVFSSIQGEGPYVGVRQIFVRFAHCHLKCTYCDTPMTTPDGLCHIETTPGGGPESIKRIDNPVALPELLTELEALIPQARHHSISFTGGEPLLYHRYLAQLFPEIQKRKLKTYLETSGTQPEFLKPVLPYTDIAAMDIKIPSCTGEAPEYENHKAFYNLLVAQPKTKTFIKLIFNDNITPDEISAVGDIVSKRETPVILQPETTLTDKQVHVSAQKILSVASELSKTFLVVRVIPQTHKMINVL